MREARLFGSGVGCLVLAVTLALAWGGTDAIHADDRDSGYKVVEPDDIYLGDARDFQRPSVLELAEVFEHIEPYQQIVDKGLTEADAEYWLLLEKANRIFDDVLAVLSRRGGYDLIGELGSVVAEGDAKAVPDLTRSAAKLAAGFGSGGAAAVARARQSRVGQGNG